MGETRTTGPMSLDFMMSGALPPLTEEQQQADLDAMAPPSRTISRSTSVDDGSDEDDEEADPRMFTFEEQTAWSLPDRTASEKQFEKFVFGAPRNGKSHVWQVPHYSHSSILRPGTVALPQPAPQAPAPSSSFLTSHREPTLWNVPRTDSTSDLRSVPAPNEPSAAPLVIRTPQNQTAADDEQADQPPPCKKRRILATSSQEATSSAVASTTPIVTVRAGHGNVKTFYVHRGQLSKSSLYFKGLPTLLTICLGNHPAAFALYVDWLYTDTIPFHAATTDQEAKTAWTTLAQAYILGSELKDQPFQDTVADAIRSNAQTDTPTGPIRSSAAAMISILYSKLRAFSPAHTLMIDIVRHFEIDWLASNHKDLPKLFLVDLMLRSGGGEVFYWEDYFSELMGERCSYHGHGEEGVEGQCYMERK